jgi:hypothetical protein
MLRAEASNLGYFSCGSWKEHQIRQMALAERISGVCGPRHVIIADVLAADGRGD